MTPLDEPAHVDHSLRDTEIRMHALQVPFLPVVDGDEVVGVVALSEVQRARGVAAVSGVPPTVRDVMSTTFAYCHDNDSLEEAYAAAETLHVEGVVVVDRNNLLVGCAMKEVLRAETDRTARDAPVMQHKAQTSGLAARESAGRPKGYTVRPRVQGSA